MSTKLRRSATAALLTTAVFTGLVYLVIRPPVAGLAILGALAFAVFFVGYLRSPYFFRGKRGGPPCDRCGGTGYRLQAFPFHLRRDPCPVCRGSGCQPNPEPWHLD